MPADSFKNLTQEQKDLGLRIFDLVLGRTLKATYIDLDEKGRKNMGEIFLSDNHKDIERFIKKYIPNFKKLFKEESQKVENEIKLEIEKQIQ